MSGRLNLSRSFVHISEAGDASCVSPGRGAKRGRAYPADFKRENSGRFPFERSTGSPLHLRWLRRIWNIQIRNVPPQAYPGEVRSIRTLLAEDHCKLLHIYFGNNGLFWLPLLNRCPVPTIVSFHGADVGVNVDSSAARRLFLELFASCTLVLARSESLASSLLDLGCSSAKLRIQRAGIPLDTFRYMPRRKPANGAWRLLQACRLIAKKGLEMTIRAFAAFSKGHPNASLTIAGDGPLRGVLEDLATRLRLSGKSILRDSSASLRSWTFTAKVTFFSIQVSRHQMAIERASQTACWKRWQQDSPA